MNAKNIRRTEISDDSQNNLQYPLEREKNLALTQDPRTTNS